MREDGDLKRQRFVVFGLSQGSGKPAWSIVERSVPQSPARFTGLWFPFVERAADN